MHRPTRWKTLWDDVAATMNGTRSFLMGDRILDVMYQTSFTDQSGAIRLAKRALAPL